MDPVFFTCVPIRMARYVWKRKPYVTPYLEKTCLQKYNLDRESGYLLRRYGGESYYSSKPVYVRPLLNELKEL